MRTATRLVLLAVCAAAVAAETVAVDAALDRHAIDPRIYGVAVASPAQLADLGCPLDRWGGNTASTYDWQQNCDNKGNDWYFESIASGPATAGGAFDDFIQGARAGGAEPMVTVPMLPYVARVGANREKLCSFSVAKYGAQTGADAQWFPDAGNGVRADGHPVTGNDPTDASLANDPAFQRGLVQHVVTRWAAQRPRWWLLDNEPGLWSSTHRDVVAHGLTMQQLRDRMVAYATMVKDADPSALVAGPEEWGWTNFLYSAADTEWAGANGWDATRMPDRVAHGGTDQLPWLLAQMQAASASAGRRLLDAVTVHWYPQGGEYPDGLAEATKLRRNRSTRSLWDPTYVDESWVNAPVQLIPRLKGWVAANYPGTQIGITEYSWGAEGDMNGATAQADVFGIFGREGLDLATRWGTPASGTPTYAAMKLFRDYDGSHHGFGQTAVRATAPDPDTLSAFAALRDDGALTVVAVHKRLSGSTTLTLGVAHFAAAATAQVWQVAGGSIARLADLAVADGRLVATLPGPSVTLFVLPAAGTSGTTTGGTTTGGGTMTAGGTTTAGTSSTSDGSHGHGHGCGLGGASGALALVAVAVLRARGR